MVGVGLVVVILMIDMLLRLYVGSCAMAEARGNKQKSRYLVLAGMMMLFSLFTVFFTLDSVKADFDTVMDVISTVIVEITSFITLMQLVVSACRIRKMTGTGPDMTALGQGME